MRVQAVLLVRSECCCMPSPRPSPPKRGEGEKASFYLDRLAILGHLQRRGVHQNCLDQAEVGLDIVRL